jgi:hypothetical protein
MPARWRRYQEILDADLKIRQEFFGWQSHFGFMGRNHIEAACAIARRCAGAEEALRRLAAAGEAEAAAAEVPGLTAAQVERLALLAEECGEVAQAVCKVLRHGWRSRSPFGGPINRVALERGMGDVRAAIDMMIQAGDVRRGDIAHWRQCKRASVGQWLHHQVPQRSGRVAGAPEAEQR